MKTIERIDTRLSRRGVLRASVYAGAGFALFAPLGFRASARQDSFNIAFIQGVIGDNFYITMDCGARAKAEVAWEHHDRYPGPGALRSDVADADSQCGGAEQAGCHHDGAE